MPIYATTFDSTLGILMITASQHGLLAVGLGNEDHDQSLRNLHERHGEVSSRSDLLGLAQVQILQYLNGERRSFDLPLDARLSSGFRAEVRGHLSSIHYGSTASYAQVAAAVGSPKAVRAVGTACATNPLPLVIPCHRVLRSDGSLGGYRGGLQAKQTLLAMEQG